MSFINVFGYEIGKKFPIYVSSEKYEKELDLLLITQGDKWHYVLIKDFNRFMYDISKNEGSKHFCKCCLQYFTTKKTLEGHIGNCLSVNGAQAVEMPSDEDRRVRFRNFHNPLKVPFVVYADFGSIVERVDNPKGIRTQY